MYNVELPDVSLSGPHISSIQLHLVMFLAFDLRPVVSAFGRGIEGHIRGKGHTGCVGLDGFGNTTSGRHVGSAMTSKVEES